jgi:histidinol-phosphatase
MSPRLAFALETVHLAGRLTLGHFQTDTPVDLKADVSPVTVADREAEAFIRRQIAAFYPADGVLGEEEGGEAGGRGERWVIDPIDGTKSFICGVPLYATLLSFERDGEAELGVCYFPALDDMIYAERGAGAFLNGRPIRVSRKASLERAVLSCGSFGSMKRYRRLDPFLDLSERVLATRTWSDAYGHALVAKGMIEAMVDPIVNPWDISPMSIIVREAGGVFTDLEGNHALSNDAISSNGLLHDQLLEAFKR